MSRKSISYSPAELAFVEARKDMPRRRILVELVEAFSRTDLVEDHVKALCKRKGWTTRCARPANVYSDDEIAFVESRKADSRRDLHEAFIREFGRSDVTLKDLQGLCTRQGWTTRQKAPVVKWSEEEIAFVEANQIMARKDLHAAVIERFGRPELTEENVKSLCSRRGFTTGRTGGFEKGVTPSNKGKKCPEGVGGRSEASRRTQFRKGQVPHTFCGVGHERVDDEGYVWIIVDGINPHTGASTKPVMKHRLLWEQAHGPILSGQILKCLDGNRQNCVPSNWTPIHRGVLSRLNAGHHRKTVSYDEAPAELKPLVLTVAKLKHAVGHRAKRAA